MRLVSRRGTVREPSTRLETRLRMLGGIQSACQKAAIKRKTVTNKPSVPPRRGHAGISPPARTLPVLSPPPRPPPQLHSSLKWQILVPPTLLNAPASSWLQSLGVRQGRGKRRRKKRSSLRSGRKLLSKRLKISLLISRSRSCKNSRYNVSFARSTRETRRRTLKRRCR